MSRRFASSLSPAPVSTSIVIPPVRTSTQFMQSWIRFLSSGAMRFSHSGFGTTPNIAPPSRRNPPSLTIVNSKSPSLTSTLRSQLSREFHSPRNTDQSRDSQSSPPTTPAPPRQYPPASRARSIAAPATRPSVASTARSLSHGDSPGPTCAAGSAQFPAPVPKFPCSRSQPFAPQADASRRAPVQSQESPAIVPRTDPPPRGRTCSTRKCRRSPSTRLSNSAHRRPYRAPARPACNPPTAQFQSRPARLPQSRRERILFPPHRAAAPYRSSPAPNLP